MNRPMNYLLSSLLVPIIRFISHGPTFLPKTTVRSIGPKTDLSERMMDGAHRFVEEADCRDEQNARSGSGSTIRRR